jgi:hypothetical protein
MVELKVNPRRRPFQTLRLNGANQQSIDAADNIRCVSCYDDIVLFDVN